MNIQGTLFETESPQLPIHDVMGGCLDASNAKVRDFTIREVDYKTCVSFCQIWHKWVRRIEGIIPRQRN